MCHVTDVRCLVSPSLESGRWLLLTVFACAADPCPPEAAVCLLGGPKPVNLAGCGTVLSGARVILLKYVDGDLCPDQDSEEVNHHPLHLQ